MALVVKFQLNSQVGVGLAVKHTFDTQTTTRLPEFISDRLLKVTQDLRGRAKALSFVVAYAPTETAEVSRKNMFWAALDSSVAYGTERSSIIRY